MLWALTGCGPAGGDPANGTGAPDADADAAVGRVTPEALAASALAAAQGVTTSFLMDRVHVLASDDFAGRDNQSPGGVAARQWLAADLANLGLQPLFASGYAHAFDAGVNLCAKVPGSDPAVAHELVVVGAHYDHLGTVGAPKSQCKASPPGSPHADDTVCNGAVDNAAGVAVGLAVARALAQSAARPRRSVVLCLFDAEEDGLLGSRALVKRLQGPASARDGAPALAEVVAMLSVDNVGSEILPGEASSFATDVEFSHALRAAVKRANDATGMVTWPVSSFFVGQEGGGRSDHLPFREAKVPVVFLGSGSSAEYHSTADEPGVINQSKLLGIARHAVVLVADIANAAARPDLVAAPQPHLDDARALVSLAGQVLANPKALGLNPTQVELVKGWRADLQAWIDTPPTTDAQWAEYASLVKGILQAVYLVVGG